MKHFIYKTTHTNGKYYIGRHSTTNIDDGYIGSGNWPLSIKDKTSLIREILEFVDDFETLKKREGEYLAEHFGKPNCMNGTPDPVGFASGENNPMNRDEVRAKFQGENHWTNRRPELVENISGKNHWMNQNPDAKQAFLDNHPNKDGRNARLAYERGTHNSITSNPSTVNAANGKHHWQNGKSPNYQGKLNQRLIEEGRHNFLGPETNKKRIDAGTHNFVGPESNIARLAAGTHPSQQKKTCEHCGKESSVGMYKRWHGNNCKNVKEAE